MNRDRMAPSCQGFAIIKLIPQNQGNYASVKSFAGIEASFSIHFPLLP